MTRLNKETQQILNKVNSRIQSYILHNLDPVVIDYLIERASSIEGCRIKNKKVIVGENLDKLTIECLDINVPTYTKVKDNYELYIIAYQYFIREILGLNNLEDWVLQKRLNKVAIRLNESSDELNSIIQGDYQNFSKKDWYEFYKKFLNDLKNK